jgi:hypothetical protein
MSLITFYLEHLEVNRISFNLEDLYDSHIIASRLWRHFIPDIIVDGESGILYHGLKKI